ncbi:hypothetical protein AXF42_Ash015155 [Apostasia shenzhenica]|uniref:Peroxin/Ferlin domain-containing protein n=1 Tax=Apostasia shenzhenica TaxID=1088818 RepID=A0A2I0AQG3_9ASPA|nr:hypothetical protein AXF42_Ash015155 [Apostasia shenzhenica]
MFEAHVLYLLRKYLDEYVEGLSIEALRISVWKGDVLLKDLRLKPDALNSLKLPVAVKAGFVGTITLKVPWKSLGKEPVVVVIDRVFVLAEPVPDGQTLKDQDREKLFDSKLQQIEDAESAIIEATIRNDKSGAVPSGNSWLGSLVATIIGNLKVTISNVHIRYEDSVSNPGHPFCSGITLSKLAAVTTDEEGNETFDTSGALDKLRKSLQLERLAMYHDSDCAPWTLDKRWEDLSPALWAEMFEDGICELTGDRTASLWAKNRRYLVSPINGVLKYHRLGKQERNNPQIPFEKASFVLSDVSLTVSEAQYYDGIKLLEAVSRFKTCVEVSHLRPVVPVFEDPHAWWRYGMLASLQQKKLCYWFSWERIKHLCQLRRRYVQMYAAFLQHSSKVDVSVLRQIERILDSKVIILWRLLAHAKHESVKSKWSSQQKGTLKRSWWSLGWSTSSEESLAESTSSESQVAEEDRLTKEEWQAINKFLSFQPEEDYSSPVVKDGKNMIHLLVDVSIGKAAASIVSIDKVEIVCGSFEQLGVTIKMYHKSIHCDVSLKCYGLSSPEGQLSQSVSSANKTNALEASFVHVPVGEDVHWRLSATIAPCHVTILMESYERFLEFMKRSNAVSPTVTMETATALQMKIESVTRKAQEQLQMVLEEKSRFSLDVDFDAPKVRIPVRSFEILQRSQFLLDFGHFTLHTRVGQNDEQKQSLYSRFYICGKDMAAVFVDGDCGKRWGTAELQSQVSLMEKKDVGNKLYSLLDRCGMSVIVDQIKVPHPKYPSTRISVQVPNLGIHFSAERYSRILNLLDLFYGSCRSVGHDSSGVLQAGSVPWLPADFATDARILVWKGFGHSLAEWQPCYIVLSGLYLYVLESEGSQTYQRCCSVSGRQVFEISPSSVGGSHLAVAVGSRGVDIQKALESANTLIIEFRDSDEKNAWLKELVQATYRASAPPAVDILGDQTDQLVESITPRLPNTGVADLVISGALVETKLSIYGKCDGNCGGSEETLIVELLGSGGKVNLYRSSCNLIVKTKLHSLKIKDELQDRFCKTPQYLACSVLKENKDSEANTQAQSFFMEEEDYFADALPDFIGVPDQALHTSLYIPGSFDQYSGKSFARASNFEHARERGGEVFYEAWDSHISDFVVFTFVSRSVESPLYDGIDTQMRIQMSALEFFCNRPTLVALIGFGFDVSQVNSTAVQTSDIDHLVDTERKDEDGRALVKGLLGYGKGRVVFNLVMDVDSVCVFLNKEDGLQLAMFVQESFILNLKFYPSSTTIEGTLGNMRLCDMSLGTDHCWGWLCDIRNQGIESLIKFNFESYSAEDDDYQGYDYSLSGRLSAVRIVFLYRFVLEITSYFMGLATPHTEEVIKLVDKVGGIEWLIQKYEMDGTSALKLDLSLDTPVIIVPKNSMSEDFIQLDLGRLHVKNKFSWYGCKENDPSAVHMDIINAEIHGINMAVGVNGRLGKLMVREGQGLHVIVQRSLRDVFQKVPTLSIEVQVGLLHCVMSDKEYDVIINCLYMNLLEPPKIPPSFRSTVADAKDSMRMLVDKVNLNGQILLSRNIVVFAVEIHYALLELCNGLDEESPLAQISLEGLWVSYRSTSFSEVDLFVTIPKFSVLDIRPDAKPEMRLMLGSYADVSKSIISHNSDSSATFLTSRESIDKKFDSLTNMDVSNLTMLILDYRWRSSFHSFVIRIQQPRVLVVLDFLLAVAEFFVPSLGTITGREEILHPNKDPLTCSDDIILSESVYMQQNDVVYLSPRRQLIVDGCFNEFIYDGCGHTLSLNDEFDSKGQPHSGTIIILGRGKKLRFKNVKIENGALLRKCTYLSNDSSYSISEDDGVEISLLEYNTSKLDEVPESCQDSIKDTNALDAVSATLASQSQNFTLEAQVVSSEFTFYDSSKSSSDNPLIAEKLLRARMDLRFMYASKGNDTWARSLVKDFTMEAGSGLVILEPMDISGGYTSVEDKTNISIFSSDICIHLSLSVASLLLKLQNQAIEALQFGEVNPLVSCANFKRIWVSPKGDLPDYNLTFWRPQAPSNYAILGDCVTSRPIPPTQVVVAVSNAYGRVRKPLGFKLVVLFSDFKEMGGGPQSDGSADCSIWLPVAPPGYTAVGFVAHVGSQPPPNHVIHCLRSDLVTSTGYSDCIFHVPPKTRLVSGFSVWHVDNVIGSFYAHNSVDCPPKDQGFDLHHILLRNPNRPLSVTKNPASPSINPHQQNQQCPATSNASSGWDVLRSLSRTSCYMSTPHFERIWWDKGADFRRPISIWRPILRPGFASLGDSIIEGLEPPALGLIFKCDNSMISTQPVHFTKVAHVIGKGLDDAFFWYPIPPPGYASLGCIVTRKDEQPRKECFCCPRIDLINQANILEEPISRSYTSKGPTCWSIWKVENQACTFLARSDLKKPSSRLAYTISDSVKPKSRENISAEMKLGCFSLSILDSFYGTMTPVVDTTITNINLATHGGLNAMNAVLICSMAASTFNRQLESWEPLVEPFDGIFKLETYNTNEHPPSKIGKRIRVAATSSLNLNFSASNLETIIEAFVSRRRQNDLEHKLSRKSEEYGEISKYQTISSALDEDDFQRVVIENKLGCDIYLRTIEEISEDIELIQKENQLSISVLPPKFSDRLSVINKSRETRYYVAVQIFESKGVPVVEDGNKQDYFCALRLLIDSKVSDQYKLFPQSARTRCVRPLISKINDLAMAFAKWNELFIFEVPDKGFANLEVEVSNLAAKAGKGEVIGSLSVPLGRSSNALKRAASIRMLQQAAVSDTQNISSYPLRKKGQAHDNEDNKDSGCLLISTTYFERNIDMNTQRGMESTVAADSDVGFWVGLGPDGPWESFSSLLPLSVVPKTLDKNPFAFEVVMRGGRKHAILRALAVIKNETDVKIEISLCPSYMLNKPLLNAGDEVTTMVTEDVFENQRYQPITGWGNKSSFHGDPGHWSTRNFSFSSKDFFEPPLPSGWQWISAWRIDKSQFVDSDGWAYGNDFQSLKWPPSSSKSSSKSALDFVRRRRWIRNRQRLPEQGFDHLRNVIAVISPSSSTVLPWASMASDSDLFLQVRPFVENSKNLYVWGQIVALGYSKDQSSGSLASVTRQSATRQPNSLYSGLKLSHLEKNDILLCCNPCISSKQNTWLSVGTDASVLHTELNAPVYDWEISINSVLKLENKLPYEAEYAVWEKTIQGNMVERQHGIVSSNGSSFIFSADIRRPLYLTLFVQGGWILEKEAILIMDLLNHDHASSFWMVQRQSQRRVRVSIEYDMGGTDAAPKSVRLFVPYWIRNDSSVPLSYHVVEVDPFVNVDADTLLLSREVKSTKLALKHSTKSIDRKFSCSKRNFDILEVIDDFNLNCVMLSPQDYMSRSGSSFSSRRDGLSSTRVGISVAMHHSEHYSPGVSLMDLERKEQVDVNAFSSDGSYYKLSAQLKMSSDRTKVISFLPHTLFINRVGTSVCLSQCNSEYVEWLHPDEPPKLLKWQSSAENELLMARLDGYNWSTPFSIRTSGVMRVSLKNDDGSGQMYLRVEVRSGEKSSRYEVVFRLTSLFSPYRIENRSFFLPIRFRQVGSNDDCWHCLPPNSAASFFWEDLGKQRLLQVLVDGADSWSSQEYNIDEIKDHQVTHASSGPMKALRIIVLKEGKLQIARISDWMPENEAPMVMDGRIPLPMFEPSENDYKQSSSELDCEFHIIFELAELGLSIIDHMPEEILYLSIQNLLFSYSSGIGSGITRLKLRMNAIQVDNQLPFTPMPVLFVPQKVGDQLDYVLKFSMTMQTNNALDYCAYPYLGLQVPDNSVFLVNIHEPVIWRLHELFQQVKYGRLFGSTDTAVSVDPMIKIGLLNIFEIRFRVSMAMSPSQRPRGVLGFWSSLMTALGNTEHMQIRVGQRFREEVCMRQSTLISTAISNIQKDLLSHPLHLLSGVDILGNASSALSNMSKGVAALSMDKKFIQSRQKQDSKGVEDLGDVIREGGGALAKGFFRGVTGIVTKPLEGAKSSGVEGFVQGVGKGIIGAAAQPVSGVLDLLSKTTEGANAMRMKIASAITSEEQLLRRRLPRAIGGDNLLRPYDDYAATGQVILQLAECGTFLGQVDLFKVRGKFALSDAYEDHFILPTGKILIVTHRRALFLQQPTNIMAQRKFNPTKDPCSVIWDVLWEDLVTMELTHGKKDIKGSPPSRLILYMQITSTDSKENIQVIKCSHGTGQANEIFAAIQAALMAYGPNASKDINKGKVPRPYMPCNNTTFSDVLPKEVYGSWSIEDVEELAPTNLSLPQQLLNLNP